MAEISSNSLNLSIRIYCCANEGKRFRFWSVSRCTRNKTCVAHFNCHCRRMHSPYVDRKSEASPIEWSREIPAYSFSRETFFSPSSVASKSGCLLNTPTDLYLLIACYALYEPMRESRSINAVKNNSALRKKERKRERGSANTRVVRGQRRFTGIVVLVLLYILIERILLAHEGKVITQYNKRLCAALVPVRTRYNDLQDAAQRVPGSLLKNH